MEEGCEGCKKWEEHYYWDHLDVERISFFKIMMGDFARRMIVPKKFVNHFRGDLSSTVDLKNPAGSIWHIGLVKDPDDASLETGWSQFVSDHHIEEHDLLVFKYHGNSCFKVLMFDSSGCEKASSYFVKNHDSKNQEKRDHSVESLNTSSHRNEAELSYSSSSHDDIVQTIPRGRTRNSSRANRTTSSGIHHLGSRRYKRTRSNEHFFRQKKKCGGTRAKHHIKQESDGSEDEKLTHATFYKSHKLHLTDEEKKEAMKLNDAVQRGNPSFLSVMQPTYLCKSFRLTIPVDFARTHLRTAYAAIQLQTPLRKDKWPVSFLSYESLAFFAGGWKSFAIDNQLKEGDVCLFELIRIDNDITMTVHISRVVDEAVPSKGSSFRRRSSE